jgi:F-type H+-transporting ATPase subunit b
MREAKTQAAEIVNQAHRRANEIVDEAKGDARLEGERILTAAKADIEQEANRAREALREKVAELALAGAEKIVRRELDADAHRDILDGVAKQI